MGRIIQCYDRIQNAERNDGITYLMPYNYNDPADILWISNCVSRYSNAENSWLTLSDYNGIIPGGESQNIDLNFMLNDLWAIIMLILF